MSSPARRSPASPIRLEPLEGRRHLSVSYWSAESVSSITDFSIGGDVRYGDNGDPYGMGEAAICTPSQQLDVGLVTWDGDPYDGIDSGWRSVVLDATLGATDAVDFAVGSTAVAEGADLASSIGAVTIRAAVSGPDMAVEWDAIVVRFYRDGQLVETVSVDDLSADRLGSSDPDPYEAGATVTPSASDYDRVVISGQVRVRAAEGTYPWGTDLFAQVLISG